MVKKYIPFAYLCNNTVTAFVIKSIWDLGIIVGVIEEKISYCNYISPSLGRRD